MSWKFFDAIKDIVVEPIRTLCDLGAEPVRRWDHSRAEKSADNQHQREMEREKNRINVEFELRKKEKKLDLELELKREKGLASVAAEIDEWRKDKELERMKETSEAIMHYKERLTRLNVEAITALGNMQLELRSKAQDMIGERFANYEKVQKLAIDEAASDLKRIDSEFSGNERMQDILINAVDRKLSNVISTAEKFLDELSKDISVINNGISLLSERGETFVMGHLEKIADAGEYRTIDVSPEHENLLDKK